MFLIQATGLINVFHLTNKYMKYRMIVHPDQEHQFKYKEGWSCPSGSASFAAKVMLSLNGVDPSFMNSVAGSY